MKKGYIVLIALLILFIIFQVVRNSGLDEDLIIAKQKLKDANEQRDSLVKISKHRYDSLQSILDDKLPRYEAMLKDTIKTRIKYATIHDFIVALPPARQDSFLRSRLPTANPYE